MHGLHQEFRCLLELFNALLSMTIDRLIALLPPANTSDYSNGAARGLKRLGQTLRRQKLLKHIRPQMQLAASIKIGHRHAVLRQQDR